MAKITPPRSKSAIQDGRSPASSIEAPGIFLKSCSSSRLDNSSQRTSARFLSEAVRNVHKQIQWVAKTMTALLFCKKEAKNSYLVSGKLPRDPTQRAKVFWFFFSKKNAFFVSALFWLPYFSDGHSGALQNVIAQQRVDWRRGFNASGQATPPPPFAHWTLLPDTDHGEQRQAVLTRSTNGPRGNENARSRVRGADKTMSSTLIVTPAAEITARLDRLPMTRHMWLLVLLISLGGWFDTYSIFLTGTIAPGLFADKIFTPTTVAFFGFTGLASFIAALFTGLFIGTMFLTRFADKFGRRTVFTWSLIWYSVCTTIMAFQSTAEMVNFWRLLGGIGIGIELVTVDTYISELVPKKKRGRTFAIQQSIGFIAVPVVTLLAWIFVPTAPFGLSGWRWVVLFDAIGAIVVWWVRFSLPNRHVGSRSRAGSPKPRQS